MKKCIRFYLFAEFNGMNDETDVFLLNEDENMIILHIMFVE